MELVGNGCHCGGIVGVYARPCKNFYTPCPALPQMPQHRYALVSRRSTPRCQDAVEAKLYKLSESSVGICHAVESPVESELHARSRVDYLPHGLDINGAGRRQGSHGNAVCAEPAGFSYVGKHYVEFPPAVHKIALTGPYEHMHSQPRHPKRLGYHSGRRC